MITTEKASVTIEEAPPTSSLVNAAIMKLRDAEARAKLAEAHASDADLADKDAAEAAHKALTLRKRADDMAISAGLLFIELRAERQISHPGTWKDWIKSECILSHQRVMELVKIASSRNPSRAAVEHREKGAARKEKERNNTKNMENIRDDGNVTDVSPIDAVFSCPDCDEEFSKEVWHCSHCDHHWLTGTTDICKNCYKPRTGLLSTERVTDPCNYVMAYIKENFTAEDHDRFVVILNSERIALGKQPLTEAKPTPKPKAEKPKPVPVDPRITNAVDRYFALGDKKIWTLQRMKDQPPYPELITTGPHIDFVQAFWGCPVAEQQAILDAIKVADERNKP